MDENEKKMDVNELIEKEKKGSLGSGEFDDSLDDLDYDIDKIVLSEHIATGQQIEKFSLYGQINGKWKKIFAGTVIGSKRICRFEEARMQYIKLVIEETRCFATIARFEAY